MTVSRVMNGSTHVSRHTRDGVIAAIRELNYRPNRVARILRGSETGKIRIFVRGNANAQHLRMALALEHAAHLAARPADVVLSGKRITDTDDILDTILEDAAAGVIVVDPDIDTATFEALWSVGIPLVLITASDETPGRTDIITTADDVGAHMATAHLAELGHTRIGHIAGPVGSTMAATRQKGWERALTDVGLPRGPLARGDWTTRSGAHAAEQLMTDPNPPTAIFVADDLMAMGAQSALAGTGLRIPEDISIIGFGDIAGADATSPGLTTVWLDYPTIATRAIQALDQHRTDKNSNLSGLPRLMIRGSAGRRGPTRTRRKTLVRNEMP